jgi:dienelactone hydrolase
MSPSTIEQLKVGFAHAIHATSKTFQIDMWLARQTPDKVMPILRKVLAGIHQEFADAVSHGGGVYAVGYCFGGKYVLLLASNTASQRARQENETEPQTEEPLIKAGVVAHATSVTEEDIQNVNVPICLVCVEDDPFFPNEIRDNGKKHLEEKGVTHEQKIYPGVPHGFAVVGDYKEERIQEAQKEAYEQMLTWLQSH